MACLLHTYTCRNSHGVIEQRWQNQDRRIYFIATEPTIISRLYWRGYCRKFGGFLCNQWRERIYLFVTYIPLPNNKIAPNHFNDDIASRRIQRASKAFGSFQTNHPNPARSIAIGSTLLSSGYDPLKENLGWIATHFPIWWQRCRSILLHVVVVLALSWLCEQKL